MFRSFIGQIREIGSFIGQIGSFLGEIGSFNGEKMETLRTKGKTLKCRAEDIISQLKDAEFRSRKKRKREVEDWLENVERKRNELQNLEQDVQKMGILSPLLFGKRAENMIKEMDELLEQCKVLGGLFLDVHESKEEPFFTTKLMGEAFQNNLQKILELLKKDDVLSIGIYGMGGVGKTTLAIHIHNFLLKESNNIFNHVYWVTVSHDFSIRKLQDMIATVLKQRLKDKDDERKRAAVLSQALQQRGKCVLILDDVWEGQEFRLEEVGICLKVNGCKLILTTRSFGVCRRMACQEKIEVQSLPEKETWDLFKETLGHGLALSPDIEKVALSIAKRCAGLPLGIITMARSMRGVNDIHEWRNVLEELENPTTGQRDMQDQVFPILKLSYDRLKDAKLQHCFLYCALYPEDHKIERKELITVFIVEGIIDRKKSMQAKFDMGHTWLNKLENACLLESCEDENGERCVKMHDLMREMALEITKVSPRFMVATGHEKQDGLEWMEDLEKVSLMKCRIQFPEGMSPRCPKLSTLLWSRDHLCEIPHSFFVHMPALRVLDLSYNEICELPNSIENLENLTGLFLQNCYDLVYVPPLGNLMALQVLNLSDTNIEEVPQGMERLTGLFGLFLEDCRLLKYVPPLGNLTALQVLNLSETSIEEVPQGMEMLVNLNCLYMQGMRNNFTFPTGILHRLSHLQVLRLDKRRIRGVRSGELKDLTLLEEIECRAYDICDFKQFVKSQCFMQLSLCDIAIGDQEYVEFFIRGRYRYTKKDQSARTCNISLVAGDGGNVDAALLPRDIQKCYISCCDEIEYIVRFPFSNEIEVEEDSGEESRCVPFQSLEILILDDLENLRALIKWGRQGGERVIVPLPVDTFSNLKALYIFHCDKIKNLFQPGLLQYLQNLERISAISCSGMEEIIAEDDEGMGACNNNNNNPTTFSLPKLKEFELIYLPLLKSICKGVMACDSIETIEIVDCRQLKRVQFALPLINGQPVPPHALQRIDLATDGEEWWESLEWDHPNDRNVLQPFVKFCKISKARIRLLYEEVTGHEPLQFEIGERSRASRSSFDRRF